jgi:nitrite reductase/ring-hydroxylating ferredoxin subunit
MPEFVKVARLAEIHERRGMLVTVDGEEIALFKCDGEVHAISNVCAHQHFSMLHKGEVDGCIVTCPMHGWKYDMRTGKGTTGDGRVARFRVRTVGEAVMIEIPDPP